MDSTFYVPTPKQASKHDELTRDQRLRVQTLFNDAHFTIPQIALQTGHTERQIRYALAYQLTPQKKRCGRRVMLNTPQRKRLIQWVTASQQNRETPWIKIPGILGLDCGEYAIRTAFKKEGFVRRVSRRKPSLSEENRKKRLEWAQEHKDWTDEQWDKILWSDETWAQPGRHTKIWTTRKIGEEEVYYKDCVQARY